MSDGLVTRIGKWIDSKFEESATFAELQEAAKVCTDRHIGLLGITAEFEERMKSMSKDLAELKTRMEKMELYSGMTRKVDPTKPPVAKSAFSM